VACVESIAPMAIRKCLPSRRARSRAPGSWAELLATTTLGDAAHALRTEVRADGLADGVAYRLVVQSYDAVNGRVPRGDERPVGSAQRWVTAEELRHGVHMNLVEFRRLAQGHGERKPLVVAWIEPGERNLDFDGRTARPRPGSVYGVVKRATRHDLVQISLNRKVAA